ncbi:hypothetical protein ADIS_4572 [Lunatimonas lonarensis]|uniref:Uncharacterized protein n=1 Tax=Lunatimonas lonarensis TaxID=1232681 RepID=R7ZLB4_9BACT|nr:hypothetical protein ADIS_4572 [Lunatimonas lonarensis]
MAAGLHFLGGIKLYLNNFFLNLCDLPMMLAQLNYKVIVLFGKR